MQKKFLLLIVLIALVFIFLFNQPRIIFNENFYISYGNSILEKHVFISENEHFERFSLFLEENENLSVLVFIPSSLNSNEEKIIFQHNSEIQILKENRAFIISIKSNSTNLNAKLIYSNLGESCSIALLLPKDFTSSLDSIQKNQLMGQLESFDSLANNCLEANEIENELSEKFYVLFQNEVNFEKKYSKETVLFKADDDLFNNVISIFQELKERTESKKNNKILNELVEIKIVSSNAFNPEENELDILLNATLLGTTDNENSYSALILIDVLQLNGVLVDTINSSKVEFRKAKNGFFEAKFSWDGKSKGEFVYEGDYIIILKKNDLIIDSKPIFVDRKFEEKQREKMILKREELIRKCVGDEIIIGVTGSNSISTFDSCIFNSKNVELTGSGIPKIEIKPINDAKIDVEIIDSDNDFSDLDSDPFNIKITADFTEYLSSNESAFPFQESTVMILDYGFLQGGKKKVNLIFNINDPGVVLSLKGSKLENYAKKIAFQKGWEHIIIEKPVIESVDEADYSFSSLKFFEQFESGLGFIPYLTPFGDVKVDFSDTEIVITFLEQEANNKKLVFDIKNNDLTKYIKFGETQFFKLDLIFYRDTDKDITIFEERPVFNFYEYSPYWGNPKKLAAFDISVAGLSSDEALKVLIREIKSILKKKYSERQFKYLLIVSPFDEIPYYKKEYPYGSVGEYPYGFVIGDEILDSFFYGDVDEDNFIDLAVGRIVSDAEQYSSLDDDSVKTDFFTSYAVSSDYPLNLSDYYCQFRFSGKNPIFLKTGSKTERVSDYSVPIFVHPNDSEFSNLISNSKFLVINAHGSHDCVRVGSIYCVSDLVPLPNRPIIVADSCSSAIDFGSACISKQARAYIGCMGQCHPRTISLSPSFTTEYKTTIGLLYKDFLNREKSKNRILLGDPSAVITNPINKKDTIDIVYHSKRLILRLPKIKDIAEYFCIDGSNSFSGYSVRLGDKRKLLPSQLSSNLTEAEKQNVRNGNYIVRYVVFDPFNTRKKELAPILMHSDGVEVGNSSSVLRYSEAILRHSDGVEETNKEFPQYSTVIILSHRDGDIFVGDGAFFTKILTKDKDILISVIDKLTEIKNVYFLVDGIKYNIPTKEITYEKNSLKLRIPTSAVFNAVSLGAENKSFDLVFDFEEQPQEPSKINVYKSNSSLLLVPDNEIGLIQNLEREGFYIDHELTKSFVQLSENFVKAYYVKEKDLICVASFEYLGENPVEWLKTASEKIRYISKKESHKSDEICATSERLKKA